MIHIEQAIYKLQRFADVFQGGSVIESQGTWDTQGKNKIKLTLNGIATKIGIQAPPKTQFFLNDNGSNKFIIGRSGIWEINDPKQAFEISSITFYKPEILNKENPSVNISADTSTLTNITNIHTNNIETLNTISNFNENEQEFTQYEGSNSITIKLSDYWTVYTELQNYYNEAYSKAYLVYKKQLYGSYAVALGELTNIIIDYEYETEEEAQNNV